MIPRSMTGEASSDWMRDEQLDQVDARVVRYVPNVVFPTSLLAVGQDNQVFYGAADTSVIMARFSKRSVLNSLSPQSEYQI